jgi:hypothetical protein
LFRQSPYALPKSKGWAKREVKFIRVLIIITHAYIKLVKF